MSLQLQYKYMSEVIYGIFQANSYFLMSLDSIITGQFKFMPDSYLGLILFGISLSRAKNLLNVFV